MGIYRDNLRRRVAKLQQIKATATLGSWAERFRDFLERRSAGQPAEAGDLAFRRHPQTNKPDEPGPESLR